MEYLNSNQKHTLNFPVIVGEEYAIPSSDGLFSYRVDGQTLTQTIAQVDATEVSVEITAPEVQAGALKLITAMMEIKTEIGMCRKKMTFGVVDLLDIPTQADQVREILGVTEEELSDSEIELESAYLSTYKLMINNFHGLRETDDYLNLKFGQFIAIIAALKSAPQLFIRLDKKRTTENGDFQRFGEAKYFEDYLANIQAKLSEIEDELEEYLEPDNIPSITFFVAAEGTQWSIGAQ